MFADRVDAGRRLADRLRHLRGQDGVVLGLPRGGVPVAFEVAQALDAPLDVIVVRKLGVPFHPELGMGAIAEDGVRIINADVVRLARVTDAELAEVEQRERSELERRARRFRGDRPRVAIAGKIAVVVDDEIATGPKVRAGWSWRCRSRRRAGLPASRTTPMSWCAWRHPNRSSPSASGTPIFSQTADEVVTDCLERRAAAGATASAGPSADPPGWDVTVHGSSSTGVTSRP
jgi:putative phosphoribosyl transferase